MFEEVLELADGTTKRIVAADQQGLDEAVALYKKELGVVEPVVDEPGPKEFDKKDKKTLHK